MNPHAREFVAGAAGAVLGALGVLSIDMLQPTQHEQPAQGAEMAALRNAIVDLTSHIDELHGAPPAPAGSVLASPSTPSERQEVANPRQDEILSKLERTTTALETLCGLLKDAPALHPATVSELEEALGKPADWNALQAMLARPEIERNLTHLTLSVRDVIAKYGVPTRAGPGPNGVGYKLYYENDDRRVMFYFVDGLVSVIDY